MTTDLLQRFRDDGWVQRAHGRWLRSGAPTHCPTGHQLVPGRHTKHWLHDHTAIRCELDGHDTEASRWIGKDPRPERRF